MNVVSKIKRAGLETDEMDGSLKFYQIADALPWFTGEKMLTVNKAARKVTVPTTGEVTGTDGADVSEEELERWLTEDKGVKNAHPFITFFTGNYYRHARKLASNIVAFADGLHGSPSNGVINGPSSGDDEWAGVAPRVSVYEKLDEDK